MRKFTKYTIASKIPDQMPRITKINIQKDPSSQECQMSLRSQIKTILAIICQNSNSGVFFQEKLAKYTLSIKMLTNRARIHECIKYRPPASI